MHSCNLSEPHEYFIKEESQPYAFALAMFTHPVHAVVPVTRADKRQAMLAEAEASHDGPHTVIIQTCCLFRQAGKIVIRVFVCVYLAAFDEVYRFIQHPGVSGAQDVAGDSQRQPEKIVRTACAHAPA